MKNWQGIPTTRLTLGGEVMLPEDKGCFPLGRISAQNDIFFCLLTPTLRQLQKKMSLRAENST